MRWADGRAPFRQEVRGAIAPVIEPHVDRLCLLVRTSDGGGSPGVSQTTFPTGRRSFSVAAASGRA